MSLPSHTHLITVSLSKFRHIAQISGHAANPDYPIAIFVATISIVVIVTRLMGSNTGTGKRFSPLQNRQSGTKVHAASYSKCTKVLSTG
jgi:hypothetical protein